MKQSKNRVGFLLVGMILLSERVKCIRIRRPAKTEEEVSAGLGKKHLKGGGSEK